jgi:hypothetical protein
MTAAIAPRHRATAAHRVRNSYRRAGYQQG